MNANENTKSRWQPVWPTRREALLRLLVIVSVIFPLTWAVNALLVGNWDLLENRDAESYRHLIEWQIAWIAATGALFVVSTVPVLRRICPRFTPRRWFFGLACCATLAALFYAEEDWRGTRAWHQYRRKSEADGAQLDLAAFVPQPVPDEQNFAATPAKFCTSGTGWG